MTKEAFETEVWAQLPRLSPPDVRYVDAYIAEAYARGMPVAEAVSYCLSFEEFGTPESEGCARIAELHAKYPRPM